MVAFIQTACSAHCSMTTTRGGLLAMEGVMADVGSAVARDQVPHEARVVEATGQTLVSAAEER